VALILVDRVGAWRELHQNLAVGESLRASLLGRGLNRQGADDKNNGDESFA
jgi:hypothetical protein